MKKADLPVKYCLVCQRPFSWRKKWERSWEEVKYCSERCRSNKASKKKSDLPLPVEDMVRQKEH